MIRKEFYEYELKKFDYNFNVYVLLDIVLRVDYGRDEDYNDYDWVIWRDFEGYYLKGFVNFRYSVFLEDFGKFYKFWFYDE